MVSAFLEELSPSITRSVEGMDRLFRSHGHTMFDISVLKLGNIGRIPDAVVWPGLIKYRFEYK